MKTQSHERGQALILIVFAIVALVGLTGLAVDGGMAYSDRRNAQNAADTSALAAALAHARGNDLNTAAMGTAFAAGFTNDGTNNTVTVTTAASTNCPNGTSGDDITVQIMSHVSTYFGPVLGIRQVTNTVQATTRSCESFVGPILPGDAVIALTKHGNGYDAHGTPDWNITGGGVFSNSDSSSSATCGGNAGVTTPSVTTVGQQGFSCHTVNIGTATENATQLNPTDYQSLLPPIPTCDGHAQKVGGTWVAETGKDGSTVALSGDMVFGPGLYCVTNSPGPYHGQITGSGVTFYIVPNNFNLKFNGGGSFGPPLSAPTSGDYAGVLIFSGAQLSGGELQQNQSTDFRGNGNGSIIGSVIMPSATVTMFGNSGTSGYHTQIVAYNVDTGGNANININYNAGENWQTAHPAWLTLLR